MTKSTMTDPQQTETVLMRHAGIPSAAATLSVKVVVPPSAQNSSRVQLRRTEVLISSRGSTRISQPVVRQNSRKFLIPTKRFSPQPLLLVSSPALPRFGSQPVSSILYPLAQTQYDPAFGQYSLNFMPPLGAFKVYRILAGGVPAM